MDKDIQHIHQVGQQIVFHVTADKQHYIHTFINCLMKLKTASVFYVYFASCASYILLILTFLTGD